MASGKGLRATWNRRTDSWEHQVEGSDAFDRVRWEVLVACELRPDDRVLDLGAGTGFITLPIAEKVREVVAVDVSEKMLEVLQAKAQERGANNVVASVMDLNDLAFENASFDVIVSSYALHHLRDHDKQQLLVSAQQWLRSGGRIVIADMMFGRSFSGRDRSIVMAKAKRLVRKGPGGVWRLFKNVARLGLRSGTEHPSSPQFWLAAMTAAGFKEARFREIVAEAGLVRATVFR